MSTLFVSSVGGHLADLHRLVPRLGGVESDRIWVTFDTPQSRSLLVGEEVVYVDYTGPRDVKNVLRHTLVARRLFRGRHPFSTVVSAGAGIALSFLPFGRMRGASCHYIECSARSVGPSVTGRLLSRVPGVHLYTQYEGWARPPWVYAGSVLDTFVPGPNMGDGTIRRAVVTVGTMEDYGFRRLIERARVVLPADAEVLWQVGCTDVIAHAGCGSSVGALDAGKIPVLVPRRRGHGENVDDHQQLIAEALAQRGLAIVRSVDELTVEDLRRAARSSVLAESQPAPFPLAC